MTMNARVNRLNRILAAAVAALASTGALAQEGGGGPAYLLPDNSVSVGIGYSSGDDKDRQRFGLFNGLRKHDTNGMLDFNYSNRDSNTGRWMIFEGRNLFLDNRELGFTYRNLGDFRLKADYNEITRHDPRTINTSVSGIGTANPTVGFLATPGSGTDQNLELKRKGLGIDLSKRFGNFELEVTFKNEDKTGARLNGYGLTCSANYVAAGICTTAAPTALLMLPEPVDSTIRQFDAKLNYLGEKLNLTGGYYGSFYTNSFGSLNAVMPAAGSPVGNLNGGVVAGGWDAGLRNYFQGPFALPPDSQAHQFYLSGNYKLTSHTKLNFKYSYTHATQNESFTGTGYGTALTPLPASGRNNLGGEINTTRAQVGFSSHPFTKLHVHGDFLYESRDNKTPIDVYNRYPLATTWTNGAMSPSKYEAKLEANYRLPASFLLVGGVKWERENTGAWTPTNVAGGITLLRQKMDTTGYRIELRKPMSETFTGSIAYLEDRREGAGPWLRALGTGGVVPASIDCVTTVSIWCAYNRTGNVAYTQKDMQRQKVRLNGNWDVMERLNLQAFWDIGHEDYQGPTTSGLNTVRFSNFSLDASYQLSDNWKINAFWNKNKRGIDTAHSTDYDANLIDTSTTYGIGFAGTPSANFKVGGDLMGIRDTLQYRMYPDISGGSAAALRAQGFGLPDVHYNLLRLKLYGEYTLNKASTIRLDYIYDRTYFDEWTWGAANGGAPFLYSDNTTIGARQLQSVNFIRASYVYKFR